MLSKTKRASSLVLAALLVAASLAGCQNSDKGNNSSAAATANAPAWEEAMTTPFGKYPETVTYTVGQTASNYSMLDGTPYEKDNATDNVWTRYFKEKLNVQNIAKFEANDGTDYNQKVSMAIVSGEIPDIMVVPDYSTLQQLYENDLIADLTEAYNNTASDRIKEIYDSYGGRVLENAKFDGKLMAIPTTEISHGPGVLWLRKDWMDKLGLKEPKTLEDVENIITQFIEKDPGGNGPGKTVGLVVDNENVAGISGGQYSLNNIFSLYGAYPKQWIDDGSGNAVYGSIQPEMKPALTKIADMYKKGLIDRQLAVRTGDDRKALLTGGKSGSFLDNWWGSWTVADTLKLNPDAEWVSYVAPQSEDGSLTMFTGNPSSSYLVVRKGFEHPEAAVKMVSLQFDYQRYQEKDEATLKEFEDYSNLNVGGSPIMVNIDYYDAFYRNVDIMKEALETGDASKLISNNDINAYNSYKRYLDSVKKGEAPDSVAWAGYASSISTASMVKEANIKEVNPVFFGTTPSMSLKWPTLSKMELEMYLRIITGDQTPDAFDNFVDSWKKTGGDIITKEVNEALASN
ncbi:MAG: extracellular solute-binding protein [Paenibacillus macerans]|uniref:Bacterial extracellular solute-binding family protein n=1 Tax=Paenibacillus macerans TaxID=44252 RepID=A0A090Z9X3_PAEMA|nr:extracellular solute-binding protein [Paenibacillus macerans]KFN07015.1 bacterial extracellular solute-binding family protein [Paenibacillus macerans]MBS5910531.1 extracellular solute-binding protein [Paenibacillus macerans]MCY7560665.1 extracellular solute-binding protein [Paenibacillus macerans]MDU7475363.1 extracellular solute-binding protein [Paenibacillus macerans]MEC0139788.1 extracellular solute-binding protein [Paenibacillus macerans]